MEIKFKINVIYYYDDYYQNSSFFPQYLLKKFNEK